MRHACIECDTEMSGSRFHKKYCSKKCKARWRKKNPPSDPTQHKCRVCEKVFPISSGQYNKWLCSPECRRASVAKSVREFHKRRPLAETEYRERTRAKKLPDNNLLRFRRHNPTAPTACESCGEKRVLDVAHKHGHERLGEWRNSKNCRWPEMVWVLCPTCHALVDRMNYPPEELGLA